MGAEGSSESLQRAVEACPERWSDAWVLSADYAVRHFCKRQHGHVGLCECTCGGTPERQ